MVANVRNALLVATSNRSEAAVGYATMDGDTAGGLAPIAGAALAGIVYPLIASE
jgi:NAD+ synthase (glutamine-hydrolysing)